MIVSAKGGGAHSSVEAANSTLRHGGMEFIMSKVRNVRVRVSPPNAGVNPYKKGSHKYRLFQWALEQEEFTKVEFLEAEARIFDEHDQESAMTPDVRGKAWWNEFYNKHKSFVYIEAE